MQFLLSVIDHETGSATPTEMADITAFNERLRAAGHWVFAGGLEPPAAAMLIDSRDGDSVVTPGPIRESPEYVAGFWIITAPDRAVARELAAEASKACHRRLELRTLLGG